MYDFHFVKVHISKQQLDILLDVHFRPCKGKKQTCLELGSKKDVQSEKLKWAEEY